MIFQETESVELKRVLNDGFEKALVAFLNTMNGIIYVGVEDDGTVIGVPNLDETLQKIADIVTMQILPNPQEFVDIGTKYVEGKHVIEVKVSKGHSLYYIKKFGRSANGCYIRMGTSNRSMTEEQIETGFINYLERQEKTIVDTPCLNQKLTFNIFKQYLTSKGIHVNERTFNVNYHLTTQDGKYNKLAFLLADENDVSIKVATFKGKDKTKFFKRNEYGNRCLIAAVDKVIDYCDTINDTFVDIEKSAREETRMFDPEVFREAWINACVHNAWIEGVPPAVYIFNDRLEIVSIGGIPKSMTKEQFLSGESRPVNPELMHAFMSCGLVEQSGHGVPLVVQKYGKQAYKFEGDFVKVVIPFHQDGYVVIKMKGENFSLDNYIDEHKNDGKNVGTNVGINVGIKLNKTQSYVLKTIASNPNVTIEEIAREMQVSEKTIERAIKFLKDNGIIERVGSTKTGHWKILS